ncbi:MAG: FAD-binding protein, partial [Actinomycetota bacterium]|nr:FAD-binding protein [Actinomycetota bacterium]
MTAVAERVTERTTALAGRLREAVGPERVLTDRSQVRTYECDGLANFKVTPAIVVLAENRQHVVDTVRLCAEAGVPFVARGSGTGLSGGALPSADGVLLVLARLRKLGPVDADNARVVVEPGVINLWVTRDAAPYDLAYAPDPSSQLVCSIGGNVAENAGGAHCLKYGFTVNHVLGAEVVLPDGSVVHLGGPAPEHPGYDLLGT